MGQLQWDKHYGFTINASYLLGAQSIIFELRLGGAHEVAEEEAPFAEVRDLGDVDLIELDNKPDTFWFDS